MKNKKLSDTWKNCIPEEAADCIFKLAQLIQDKGGQALLVGGCVRDMFFDVSSKDWDIEVHGLSAEALLEAVSGIGNVSEVGKSFWVLKITKWVIDIDVSLPRRDSKISSGHRGFTVSTDASMGFREASRRRDFTINAIMYDPLLEEFFDPFDGIDDIMARTLRVVDETTFPEDPLRILRAVQFIARFDLCLEEKSAKIIQNHLSDLHELPKERIYEEWKKLLLKSNKPSLWLSVAMNLGIFEHIHKVFLPMKTTPQDPIWHPEGDVWIHTLMVIDEAVLIARREKLDDIQRLVLMLAAWCHDIAKPWTTTMNKEGRIISHGHEAAGKKPTEEFLVSLWVDDLTTKKVIELVAHHLAAKLLFAQADIVSAWAVRRLAKRLHPATIYELTLLSEADNQGRWIKDAKSILPKYDCKAENWLLERAKDISVDIAAPTSLTTWQDWLNLGYSSGKIIGDLIRISDELRDNRDYTKEMILDYIWQEKTPESALTKLQKIH